MGTFGCIVYEYKYLNFGLCDQTHGDQNIYGLQHKQPESLKSLRGPGRLICGGTWFGVSVMQFLKSEQTNRTLLEKEQACIGAGVALEKRVKLRLSAKAKTQT